MTLVRNLIRVGRRGQSLFWRLVVPFWVSAQGVKVGTGTRFLGVPIVTMMSGSKIEIGERAMLCSVSSHTALGVMHPIILRTMSAEARIQIGDHSGLSGTSICAEKAVVIGSNVLLGANVVIADTDFHPLQPLNRRYSSESKDIGCAAVAIEDNVFVGTGSIILKGVTIGKDSIIGAGSIVASDIPPGVIAAGNPARVIRSLY